MKRIIPSVLINNNNVVKSVSFQNHEYIGDPINIVRIFSEKEIDEILILDINLTNTSTKLDYDFLEKVVSECFSPVTYGGKVTCLQDFQTLYRLGIEKVSVNTLLFENKAIVREAVEKFGAQAVVGSIDYIESVNKNLFAVNHKSKIKKPLKEHFDEVVELGVGEIILTNIAREGTKTGLQAKLLESIVATTKIPILVSGGCSSISNIRNVLAEQFVSGVVVGELFIRVGKHSAVLVNYPQRSDISC
ncbi:HisA/HisF-related TIM barrel protein [Amylibacter sp.]|nr:HisA/HisF-related TIM barrel protein [Amylibacter sp.]MDC0607873.1 HisA/HisF-related TIM barrel protein [Amylibacter sp.]